MWWKQAWSGWEDHPVAGTGAGSFNFTNLRYRTTSVDSTTEPHSLPVQFLSETGVVGLLLFVVAALGLVGGRAAARPGRSWRSRWRCPCTSSTGWATSTGTSSRSARPSS